MGLLKDTYNITKIDMSGIEYQMKRKNDIQERQNIAINNTRDRVDISLNEYESLKAELKTKTELLNSYTKFITDLAKSIKQNPEILLRGEIITSEFVRMLYTMNNRLLVIWEFEVKDLERQGESKC